jgi:hypothetical protein
MAEIIVKCIAGANVEFVQPCNITSLKSWIKHSPPLLARVNESIHPGMVFRQVDDGFKNSVNSMKDWHEIMIEHLDTYKNRTRK